MSLLSLERAKLKVNSLSKGNLERLTLAQAFDCLSSGTGEVSFFWHSRVWVGLPKKRQTPAALESD